jgi:hypothetical protein
MRNKLPSDVLLNKGLDQRKHGFSYRFADILIAIETVSHKGTKEDTKAPRIFFVPFL